MIGYYVHHVGRGHLHQALAIVAASSEEYTLMSSTPRPAGYQGHWLQLPRDDDTENVDDPTAAGQLHWAPLHSTGLCDRMGAIAQWIQRHKPTAFVVDVSVEVSTFVRLMGVPVVTFVLPGSRGDAAHRLGYTVAGALIAAWPAFIGPELIQGREAWTDRVQYTGAISRFDGRPPIARATSAPSVVFLHGMGGSSVTDYEIEGARRATPDWDWTVLGRSRHWSDDPWPAISSADVVVTHAGLSALAEVAAARKPAIVIPQTRPHDEQRSTARALARAGLIVSQDEWPAPHTWAQLLHRARLLNRNDWSLWCDGNGARRAAQIIEQIP